MLRNATTIFILKCHLYLVSKHMAWNAICSFKNWFKAFHFRKQKTTKPLNLSISSTFCEKKHDKPLGITTYQWTFEGWFWILDGEWIWWATWTRSRRPVWCCRLLPCERTWTSSRHRRRDPANDPVRKQSDFEEKKRHKMFISISHQKNLLQYRRVSISGIYPDWSWFVRTTRQIS